MLPDWNFSTIAKYLITVGASVVALRMLKRLVFEGTKWCQNQVLLAGKTVIITGANTGIGKATAIELAKRKAKVVLACRDLSKGNEAASEIKKCCGESADVIVKHLDLASLNSVRKFADDIICNEPRLDILINNAGVFQCPFWKTEDGFEMQFGVNHLGHFLLTNLLIPKLEISLPARIIIVSSSLYKKATIDFDNLNSEKTYDRVYAYKHSKLANLLHTHELAKRLPEGVTVNAVHPGVIWTQLGRHVVTGFWKRLLFPIVAFLLLKSPREGAQTIIHLATDPDVETVSGKLFGNCKMEEALPVATDDEVSAKLWDVSEEMTSKKEET